MMKRLFPIFSLFLISLLALNSCTAGKKAKQAANFLPAALSNIEFGMTLEQVKSKRPNLVFYDTGDTFRKVYIEPIQASGIETATYYFDADGDMPFYEIIIDYTNEAQRDKDVQKLLGDPNNGEEWLISGKSPHPVAAWKFNNKLVVISKIPGSEWAD